MKIPVLLVAALALGAGSSAAQEAVNRSVATGPTGDVAIHNVAGSVRVVGWDRNEIRVTGTLGEGTERLDITTGQRTEIRVVIPRTGARVGGGRSGAHAGHRNVQGSDLEIRVPSRKNVAVQTVSADINVNAVSGSVSTRSTSGDVVVQGSPAEVVAGSTSGDVNLQVNTRRVRANTVSGDLEIAGRAQESISAEAVSGDVTVSAATEDLVAKAVSGDLELSGASRRLTTSTVSGEARIRGGSLQYGSFETVSGTLRYQGGLQRDAAFNIQSHSGDVELILPANVRADFQVSTFSGSIQNGLSDAAAQRTSRYTPGQELRFSTGSGGLVSVKTFSGTVKLLAR